MNIIAVDDRRLSLRALQRAIRDAGQAEEVHCFQSPVDALAYARTNTVDIAFLDIEMGGMNGLALAKSLKEIHGKTNIIFVTGHSKYMGSAFDMHASGYVIKPIDPERVALELEDLRNPVSPPDQGVRIQCFGNFEIFVDGKPVAFGRSKAKEALAYLVDRKGAAVSNKELAAVLWEETDYTSTIQSHLRTVLAEMTRALKAAGAEQILISRRNHRAIDATKVECDYYRFDLGDARSVNAYRGEYMSNYPWAEFTLGLLDHSLNG